MGRYADVLRSIENYIKVLTNAKMRSLDYFIKSTYADSKNEERKQYLLTKMCCERKGIYHS